MNKNLIIGILSVISVLSMGFAYYQQTVAQHYRMLSIESEIKAAKMSDMAERQRIMAEANAAEARRQAIIALEQSQIASANKAKH